MSSLGPGMITHGFLRSFSGEAEGGRACGRTTPAGSIAPVRAGPQAAYVIPLVGFALAVVGGGVRRGRIGAWIKKGPRLRFRASDAGARAARCPPLVKWANSASGRRDRWTDRRFYRSRPRTGVTPCKCSGVDSGEDVDKTWASSHRQSGLRASRCAYSSERRTTDVTSLVVRHLPDTREALGTPRAAICLERASGALFASGASTRVVRYVGVSRRRDRISQGAS